MKTFKIAKKNNEVISKAPLDFISGGTSGNDLYIVVSKNNGFELNEGGKLIFEKVASGNSGEMMKVYEEDTVIKKIVADGDFLYVYFEYVYIKPLILASYRKIESPEGYQYKLYFTGEHHMLPCDFSNDYKIYIRRGEKIIYFSNLALCFPGGLVEGCDIKPEGEKCCDDTILRFNYETMERTSILAKTKGTTSGGDFEPTPGDQVLFATNPFFHIETITIGDKKIGKINLYPRIGFSKTDCHGEEIKCDGEAVSILRYTDHRNLSVVMEEDYDAKRMFQEYQVNELFVKKIKDSIIPDFIDLEKIKYAPAYFVNTENESENVFLATGLTFNLHFRTRVSGTTDPEIASTDSAKYYFEDTWHLNDETTTWNANGLEIQDEANGKERWELYLDDEFVNSSNLIGYLGFTDDDIYNQKNRVKQSFIRLLFYDSKNPLTQNLLCYSTIFLDSGDLFGKYVKRKAWLEEEIDDYNPEDYPVVWSSANTTDPCSAITSQIMVNDEYDMTRSGEGFNIYLFRQDAPVENYPQNIYMKVEFNHAGYGRTVPLIYWKKENGEPITLTTRNYLENIYVRVRISLSERGYVYDFPDVVSAEDKVNGGRNNGIVWENERLVLNLFEPMIEPEPEV